MLNEQLAEFLAHSVELESEARERYSELGEMMAAHNNLAVAAFFERMAHEASQHLAEVEEIVGIARLPQLRAWEYRWLDPEAPESASYEAVHYRMTLREAMLLALQNERDAEAFYRHVAGNTPDQETQRIATGFAEEEHRHAAALKNMIAELGEEPRFNKLEDDEPHMPE
jgi:rubrerythrin